MAAQTLRLPGARITTGPQPWQVLQRGLDGTASVTLTGMLVADAPSTVEVRVAREYDNAPTARCDWQDAEMLADDAWRITLRIPTGGLYRIETRVRTHGVEWRNTGDKIWHVAVGDVWVIAGQSNAVGYGHGAVVDPPALGVSLFGGNEMWRLATHPLFDPTETKHPANRDSGWVDVSPWLAFGKGILEGAGVPVGLIPTALGGSALSAWDPGNPNGAVLYDNMVSMIDAAGGRVAGMVWYQGETDAIAELALTYLDRFTRFVEAFRARYGANLPIITAQINRYVDAGNDPEPARQWSRIREIQRQAARVIPNLAVMPTLDLGLSDGIHNSATANIVLGERFTRAALGMAYGQELTWRAVDLRDARFIDDARVAVRLEFDHVADHLAFLMLTPPDVVVEDDAGQVPVAKAWVDGASAVMVKLGRPAEGRAVCHLSPGYNPPTTLRDNLQRPVLAFYEVGIAAPCRNQR